MTPCAAQRRGRARADRRDARAGERARVAPALGEALEQQLDAVGARQAEQVEVAERRAAQRSSATIRIAGASMTRAPSARSRRREPARLRARARDRDAVARRAAPARSQASSAASAATSPITVIAGARTPALAALRGDRRERARAPSAGRAACRARRPRPARPRSRPAAISRCASARQRAHAHVEDERAREGGERAPVDRAARPWRDPRAR